VHSVSPGPSRRQFLTGLTATMAAGRTFAADAAGQAGAGPAMGARRIDFHHHFASPAWTSLLKSQNILAAPWEKWTPAIGLEAMDRSGTQTAMLSITTPGVWLADRGIGDSDDARRLARDTNDHGAKLVADHKGRFGLFASLPLPHIENSLREIAYVFDELKADGICLLTSFDGKWLGHPYYTPVFEELNRRRALVFVHPTAASCCRNLIDGVAESMIEYGTDTTRTIVSLIDKDAVARFPNVRFVFSHGGGTMPFLIERIIGNRGDLAQILPRPAEPKSKLARLRDFYYDTAQATNPASMAALKKVIDPSHIVFGTDYPYTTMADHVKGLRECGVFTADELRAIDRDNAIRLLPKFA
jgi:predicted TIM-barrel fold metal-dependent hydrolase